MVDRVAHCISSVGSPPAHLRPEGALAELLSTKDLYAQEPANLARYQADLLRVCKGDVRPKPARDLLPAAAAGYLSRFGSSIERGADEISELSKQGLIPKPYWDPVLRRSLPVRIDFFKRLASLGLMTFVPRIRGKVSFFCVGKKDGRQRLVLDAR